MKQKPTPIPEPVDVTADEAKDLLHITTREGVIAMIKRDELPGARKLSSKRTAPWLIPMKSIKAHPNYKERRAKAATAQRGV